MKKVIITGGAGYIGAHVVKQLTTDTTVAEIHVIDNFSQSRENILTDPKIAYHEVDIRDAASLKQIFVDVRPDIVMHFAALASVPDSVQNPSSYFDTNVIGSFNLLEAMRAVDCKKIIFSSSASVYGEPTSEVITEDHPTEPTNPYGYTKLVVENMLSSYHAAYGISSVSFRYFCAAGNEPTFTIGEYHNPETHAIPSLVETALGRRDEFVIYGDDFNTPDGTGVRDYIHVDDLASAHLKAFDLLRNNEVCSRYNLGINKGFSVKELINTVEKITGETLLVTVKGRRPGDPSCLIADSSRAMKDLDWTPQYTDVESIVKTAFDAFDKRNIDV